MSTNDLYYIRAIDGQELEIPDISDLLEQHAVKLPDDDMSMPFQISGETMKKLDEAAQKLATQITAVMAIIGGNLVYAAEALREYAECGASLEVLLAEYEEMAKLGETLNPEQLTSLRSLYYAKTRRRVALRRTEIVRANDKSFDGQTAYLKQAKISKRLPRSDMTFNARFGRLCGQETAPAHRLSKGVAQMENDEFGISIACREICKNTGEIAAYLCKKDASAQDLHLTSIRSRINPELTYYAIPTCLVENEGRFKEILKLLERRRLTESAIESVGGIVKL